MKKFLAIIVCGFVLLLTACGDGNSVDEVQDEPVDEPAVDAEPDSEHEEVSPWDSVNFTDVRQPQHLADYTPHGYIAMSHIEFMNDNLYGRTSFTYREKETAVWIVEELLAIGYEWDDIYVQEFDWSNVEGHTLWAFRAWSDILDPRIRGDALIRDAQLSQNVILVIPGQSEQKIIVGAHYDAPPYAGASDNASGVGLLLESAQRMLHHDNYHTIVYVFFGAEEVGLFGAHYFLNSLSYEEQDNLLMMINADSLFEGPYMLFGAGYAPAEYWLDSLPEDAQGQGWWAASRWWTDNLEILSNDVTEQVDEIAANLNAQHDADLIRDPRFVLSPSDHWMFAFEGHTVVNLIGMYREEDDGSQAISGFSTRVMHTPQDCFHYINENWPDKIEINMRYFSIFLEEMLLASYSE